MSKEELQKQLDERGVKYDKRWGVPKLEMALQDSEKESIKSEDSLELSGEQEEISEKVDNTCDMDNNKRVEEIRKNALIAREIVRAKAPDPQKEAGNLYKKREINDAVEVYEVNTGKFVRAYSKNVHGEDYKKLADKFIRGRIGKGMGVTYGRRVNKIIRPIV